LALNDIVIERGSLSQLINISIHSEKMLVSEIKADGLIIATPTGSTAYNLSAGGPILHPESRVFVVTPIAPHSLTSRPLIFPDDIQLSFRMVNKLQADRPSIRSSKDRAHFVVDGVKVDDISQDDEILIRRHKVDHLMVRDPAQNFFHLLREKLKFGDRA
jgi:NAD+ kinase